MNHNIFCSHGCNHNSHEGDTCYMGGSREGQRRVDRNDEDENDVGIATTVANAHTKKRSKTTDKAKDDRIRLYRELVGDFD